MQNILLLFLGRLSFSVLMSLLTPPSSPPSSMPAPPQSPGPQCLGAGCWHLTSHRAQAASCLTLPWLPGASAHSPIRPPGQSPSHSITLLPDLTRGLQARQGALKGVRRETRGVPRAFYLA